MISIVIATYNREYIVGRAIVSALSMCEHFENAEVIVVDDASEDNTVSMIQKTHKEEIQAKKLILITSPINQGVTGAKNKGFLQAKNKWVGFFDSDDLLLTEKADQLKEALSTYPLAPIIFFRCQDTFGGFIGTSFEEDQLLDLKRYLAYTSYGEALTFVSKTIVKEKPYIDELRGYEGAGCTRIIAQYGPAILSKVILRIYDTSGDTRLSTISGGMLKRLPLIAKGHRIMVREFYKEMAFPIIVKRIALSLAYDIIGFVYQKMGAK